MMIMVGCDHYDEPFNLVNNDNPDYLKISRAGWDYVGWRSRYTKGIADYSGGTENCSVACFLAVVLLYC